MSKHLSQLLQKKQSLAGVLEVVWVAGAAVYCINMFDKYKYALIHFMRNLSVSIWLGSRGFDP